MAWFIMLSVLLQCLVIFIEVLCIETVNPDEFSNLDTSEKVAVVSGLYTSNEVADENSAGGFTSSSGEFTEPTIAGEFSSGIDEPTIEKSPITPTPEPITEIPQDNSTSSDNIGINTTIGTDMTSNTERSLMDIEKNNTFVVSDESSTSENISTEVLRNCSKISTATIINYQNFDNGSLLDLDGMIIYPPGYYWSDENNSSKIYGCICLLKTCVRKCCAKGEIMDKSGQCVNKIKLYQPFTLQFMNEKTLGAESLVDYHVLYGKSCPEDKDWLVNPREYTEDSHYLLKNGQLYVPQLMKNFTVEEFCVEVFEDVNSTFPLICPVQSDSPIRSEDVHQIYSITTVEASDLEGDDTEVRHNCSKISSATIINYQYFDNGSLLDEDSMIVYPPGYYWEDDNSTEIYGCICLLKTCVRKCCSIDQAMDKDGECINQTEIVHPFKLQFIHEETLGLESSVDHHVLHGKPCPALGYRLENPGDFPEDIHYLLRSGDLYVPQLMQNFTVEEFCMETFEDENINLPLICVENESNEPMESDVQMILYPIGMILSIPFLMATFLVYIALPKLRNLHGMCLMAYVGGLFVGYIFLSIVQLGGLVISAKFCIGCAFAIYFSFNASFFWLNVMCFDIWWTFSGLRPLQGSVKEREYKKFVMYSCYAWGAPLVMLGVTLFMDLLPDIPDDFIKPEFGVEKCWFRGDKALLAYFFGPIGVIVLCNIVLFIATAFRIVHLKRETKMLKGGESKRHDEEANRQRFNLYLKLFIVMGVNWIMEVISWAAGGPSYLWYITDLGNTLQGVLIFIIFVWKKKIGRLLARRFCPKLAGNGNNGSIRSHPTPSRTSSYNNYTTRTSVSTNDHLMLKSLPNGSYRVSEVP